MDGLTRREVAKIFGLNTRRIAEIEERALFKLQKAMLDDPELREYAEEVFIDPHVPRPRPLREGRLRLQRKTYARKKGATNVD